MAKRIYLVLNEGWEKLRTLWRRARPDELAWRGAALGLFLVTMTITLGLAIEQAPPAWAFLRFVVFTLLGVGTILFVGLLASLALWLLGWIPLAYRIALIGGAAFLYGMLFAGRSERGAIAMTVVTVLAASLLGAGGWWLLRSGWRQGEPVRRWLASVSVALGASALATGVAWYYWPGPANEAVVGATSSDVSTQIYIVEPLDLEDPSQPGPYGVRTLTYGSGADLHRPEYGRRVDLQTESVDGSPYVANWRGLTGFLRTRFWGFDVARLPLNGRVWYPEGEGPFPLVLIVHGNHRMMEFSDTGYAYLGELFASRGLIAISVDQNFLNDEWTNIGGFGLDGLYEENDARAWLLLEHLAQWRRWNDASDNPFFGRVDLGRVALIGHSRGGEAVATAAAFNRLPAYPNDALQEFDYGFGIRAVAAIAPVDGQYRPAGVYTPLENVNYFVIQGAYDGDLNSFRGIRQYNRVVFDDAGDWFKAALYIGRANHGQFNSMWGRADIGDFPGRGQLNQAQIMAQADQQQIARVYLSAFLEVSLNRQNGYRALFKDHRAGRDWLPQATLIGRYDESSDRILADYEEDLDVTSASLSGAGFSAQALTSWYENMVMLETSEQGSRAVFLSWDRPTSSALPMYCLSFDELAMTETQALNFKLAAAKPGNGLIDFSVILQDKHDQRARLPLSDFSPLQPQIVFQPYKIGWFNDGAARSEIVFQRYAFPLRWFLAANPGLDPSSLESVCLVFDKNERGAIVLDEIGLGN